jgi:formylglycine-generating enzyme required for sulfatase activity
MVVIDPRGQDPSLSGGKRIDRVFAIASKEVSVPQWLRSGVERPGYQPEHSPYPDCPINVVTWYDAARYCRWLSDLERLPKSEMCYPPIDQIKEGMRLPDDYLRRTGYRLPSEAELEYACRAGALTSRFYGSSDELLPRYAFFRDNSQDHAWHVGMLRPNDFGLFDVLGNVQEWCQEAKSEVASDWDREDTKVVTNLDRRILRGGAYGKVGRKIRSDRAETTLPINRYDEAGFRVARTLRRP